MVKEELITEAKTFGIDTEGLTVPQLEAKISEAKEAKIKADQDKAAESGDNNPNSPELSEQSESNDILSIKTVMDGDIVSSETVDWINTKFISGDNTEYEITVPKFRFKGNEFISEKVVKEQPEILEELIQANSFIIKKI